MRLLLGLLATLAATPALASASKVKHTLTNNVGPTPPPTVPGHIKHTYSGPPMTTTAPSTFQTSTRRKDPRDPVAQHARRAHLIPSGPHGDASHYDTRIPDPWSGQPAPSPPPVANPNFPGANANLKYAADADATPTPSWEGWGTPLDPYTLAPPLPTPAKDTEITCYFQCSIAAVSPWLIINLPFMWCQWCHWQGYGYSDPFDDDFLPWDPKKVTGEGWNDHIQELSWDGRGWDRVPKTPVMEQVITTALDGLWGGRVVYTKEVAVETVVVYQPVDARTLTVEEPVAEPTTITVEVPEQTVVVYDDVEGTTITEAMPKGTVVVVQDLWKTVTVEGSVVSTVVVSA